jgi:hypothetical protein
VSCKRPSILGRSAQRLYSSLPRPASQPANRAREHNRDITIRTLGFGYTNHMQDYRLSATVPLYNWVEATSPIIVVPGSPALWAPSGRSTTVQKDSGHEYVDQNSARNPCSSLEPLSRALYTTRPCHDMLSTDVVTERNSLRKLLTFVEPGIEGCAPESFAIKVEVHKKTALFSRVETCSEECIESGEFRSFGRESEKVYTWYQIEGSTGHHRIVSYRFVGMSFIVRYETDGNVGGPMRPGLSSVGAEEHPGTLTSLSLSLFP